MAHQDWVDEVLDFWFGELTPADWFSGGAGLDEKIKTRFGDLHTKLRRDFNTQSIGDARAALAAAILFDQFPRNIHRGTADAFGTDDLAMSIARLAVDRGYDAQLDDAQKQFVYMPFMHSEVLADQERCVDLFRSLGNEDGLRYAIEHRDIVAKYGRFPHRNRPLGRASTPAELDFLKEHAGYGQ